MDAVGEFAIRLIWAVQELDYHALAIYETPDEMSRHIRIADVAVCIGDGPRCDYLNIDKITCLLTILSFNRNMGKIGIQ